MPGHVLVLNVDYTPHKVISWRAAMEKVVVGKMDLLEAYEGHFIRSPSVTYPYPAVVRMNGKFVRRTVKLNRANLLARDVYMCQYCGLQPRKKSGEPRTDVLTMDHVVPRAQSVDGFVVLPWNSRRVRVTSWENILVACDQCNWSKGARTPRQAGITMRKVPTRPSALDLNYMVKIRHKIPEEWKMWLPEDSPWRNYWDAELKD